MLSDGTANKYVKKGESLPNASITKKSPNNEDSSQKIHFHEVFSEMIHSFQNSQLKIFNCMEFHNRKCKCCINTKFLSVHLVQFQIIQFNDGNCRYANRYDQIKYVAWRKRKDDLLQLQRLRHNLIQINAPSMLLSHRRCRLLIHLLHSL